MGQLTAATVMEKSYSCFYIQEGTRGDVTNYRPVSLTSQACKVVEWIVRSEVIQYLKNIS